MPLAGTGHAQAGTVRAELLTESVKLAPFLLPYERGDKMELPVVTGIGFSSQRLCHVGDGQGLFSQLQSCAKFG